MLKLKIGGNNPKLADSMEWLAYSLYRQGNHGEALLLCTSSLIFIQSSLGMWHNETGTCYQNLATVLYSMGVNLHAQIMDNRANIILTVNQFLQNQKSSNKQKQLSSKIAHSQKLIGSMQQKKSEKNSNNNNSTNLQYHQNRHHRNYHNGHGQQQNHFNHLNKEKLYNNSNQMTSTTIKKKYK